MDVRQGVAFFAIIPFESQPKFNERDILLVKNDTSWQINAYFYGFSFLLYESFCMMPHQYHGKGGELLKILSLQEYQQLHSHTPNEKIYTMLWNQQGYTTVGIDDVPIRLSDNQITFFTPMNYVEASETGQGVVIQFNSAFYCVQQHDQEVSCIGLLFYGSSGIPVLQVSDIQETKLAMLLNVFYNELEINDHIQGEMLQMLLKRWIILCVRMAHVQLMAEIPLGDGRLDTIRQFNILVEMHFRQKRTVTEYADLLNKSPKTLSNLFAQYNQKSPLQIIHERLMLEAKRMIHYTDKSIKTISYELGFEDVQSFSRLFKNTSGLSPTEFKEQGIRVIES